MSSKNRSGEEYNEEQCFKKHVVFVQHMFHWCLRGAFIANPFDIKHPKTNLINLTPWKKKKDIMEEYPFLSFPSVGEASKGWNFRGFPMSLSCCHFRLSGCLLISMAISGSVLSVWMDGKLTGSWREVVREWWGKEKTGTKEKAALKKKQWFFGMRKQFPIVKVKCLKCNFEDHYGNVLWYCNPAKSPQDVEWKSHVRVEAFITQVCIDAAKT